jgi:hypothetical protein
VVRWKLVPDGEGTTLQVTHTLLADDSLPGFGAGWHAHLDMLGGHLTGRPIGFDQRFGELLPRYRELAARA